MKYLACLIILIFSIAAWAENMNYAIDPIAAKTIIYETDSAGSFTGDVTSLYDIDDVIKALELALKYIGNPNNQHVVTNYPVLRPESEVLRELADQIEQKERDIEFIRDVLRKLKD